MSSSLNLKTTTIIILWTSETTPQTKLKLDTWKSVIVLWRFCPHLKNSWERYNCLFILPFSCIKIIYVKWPAILKTLDTIGNRQRPVFSLSVPQHMHKINLWKFELNSRQSCEITKKEKNTLATHSCVLSSAWFRDLKF